MLRMLPRARAASLCVSKLNPGLGCLWQPKGITNVDQRTLNAKFNCRALEIPRCASLVYQTVLAELSSGRKKTHWMWFIFPQLKDLGRSSTAKFFGIKNRDEAVAYWQHPILGARLKECTQLVLAIQGRTAHEFFGSPDDVKLRSSMTLFEVVAPDEPAFGQVLERYFVGERDGETLRLLGQL